MVDVIALEARVYPATGSDWIAEVVTAGSAFTGMFAAGEGVRAARQALATAIATELTPAQRTTVRAIQLVVPRPYTYVIAPTSP